MMRRIPFHDELLDIRVTMDMPEEVFQDMKNSFNEVHLKKYLGQLAIQSIQRSMKAEKEK